LLADAENVIPAVVFPTDAATFVGASGTVAGVAAFDATDAVLVPSAFVAVTVNVYATPLVSPVTVIGDDPPDALTPVFDVTVYVVIAEPPFELGALNVTVASPLPAVAVPIVGASGTVAGTIELLVADAVLVPTAFVAVTVNVYVVPFVRPVMIIGDEPPYALNPPVFDVTV
jgi:hypothetical protein